MKFRLILAGLVFGVLAAGTNAQTTQTITTSNGGTVNTVPKFTGTSTIENSAIVESDGNVGIGTNNPVGKLDVNLTSDADVGLLVTDGTNASNIVIQPRTGTSSGFQALNFNGYVNSTIQRFNTSKNFWRVLVDQTGTTDQFRVSTYDGATQRNIFTATTSGDFGIGTQSPDTRLHVVGNIKIGGGGNGIIFPDGSVQGTAEVAGPQGPKGATGATGPQGPQGPAGPVVHTSSAVCSSQPPSCSNGFKVSPVQGGQSGCTVTSDTGSCSSFGNNWCTVCQ